METLEGKFKNCQFKVDIFFRKLSEYYKVMLNMPINKSRKLYKYLSSHDVKLLISL